MCTAMRNLDPTAMLASCFSTSELVKAFGNAGYLVAPVMALGALAAFFHSEFNALVDVFTGHDEYHLALEVHAPSPAPTLALASWSKDGVTAEIPPVGQNRTRFLG